MDLSFNNDLDALCIEFSEITESVSLKLIQCVQETVDALAQEQRALEKLCDNIDKIMPERGRLGDDLLDPEYKITDLMEKCEIALESYLKMLHAKQDAAIADPDLNGHHEEAVVMEYRRSITRLDNLLSKWNHLIAAIKEHDADVDTEISPIYDNPEDLIAHLKG